MNEQKTIFTVSELNRTVRTLLETGLPLIQVEGEISNLARPASGHLYFSLKDEQAQVRCAMFRNRNQLLRFRPENGMHVILRARVSLYEARGEYQLIAEHMQEAGEGLLQRRFEALKARLQAEGLFDEAHKKPLPRLPRRIGVITSPTGAAVRDVLHVIRRRFPAIPVRIYPTTVQGEQATGDIIRALQLAGERRDCDVLLLVRGGGSLEDLWSYNEEAVARAVHACPVPVISGVGHETDVTIVDFVADRRAPTPSAAAEIATPDASEWLQRFAALQERLALLQRQTLRQAGQRLDWLSGRLHQQHPKQALQQLGQRLDEAEARLQRQIASQLQSQAHILHALSLRLRHQSPQRSLHKAQEQVHHQHERLQHGLQQIMDRARNALARQAQALELVSPLATLQRGYAIAQTDSGRIVRAADEVAVGEHLHLRLHSGGLTCQVKDKTE